MKGSADLIYSIDEGKRYTIKKISTNVDPVFDKNIFFPLNEVFQKYVGDYYSPFKIKKLLEELDELFGGKKHRKSRKRRKSVFKKKRTKRRRRRKTKRRRKKSKKRRK